VTFDILIKKYFAGVVLAFVALAAYFQAAGATQLFGAALASPSSGVPVAKGSSAPIATSRQHPSAEPIIDRNPFDSVTGPLNAVAVPDGPTPTKTALDINTDPLAAPACDSPQVFIVTESTDPLWSVAALQAPGDPRPRMHRVGDDVAGKHIEFIGYNPRENTPSVWFSSGGTLCQTMLFRTQPALPAGGASPPVAAAAPPPPAGGPSPVPADIASKIQKVSDTEFNIDRSVVDKILENQAELMKSARIVPETKDGKVLGIRLFGIRPDTLLGTLGLQNGDRLEAINGFNMGSPEKALEAYARLRTAANLNVNVNRRGNPVAINFNIK
jgi:general secretion pathway protein C